MATNLQQRNNELSQLVKLEYLTMSYDQNTYDKINVAAFIENLPSIREIQLLGRVHLRNETIQEVLSSRPIPSDWSLGISGLESDQSFEDRVSFHYTKN